MRGDLFPSRRLWLSGDVSCGSEPTQIRLFRKRGNIFSSVEFNSVCHETWITLPVCKSVSFLQVIGLSCRIDLDLICPTYRNNETNFVITREDNLFPVSCQIEQGLAALSFFFLVLNQPKFGCFRNREISSVQTSSVPFDERRKSLSGYAT